MTNTLRDRIAAALYEAIRDKCEGYVADVIAAGQPIDPLADEVLVDGLLEFPALADAVIEALNLNTPVEYLSVDGKRRNFMVAGHYTVEVDE